MMRPALLLLCFLAAQALADEWCYIDDLYTDCYWGCCYSTEWYCCDSPVYAGTPFIAGITVGAVVLIVIIIAAVVYRRRSVTTIQYGGGGGGPQVFSTTTSTNAYSAGYSNQGYVARGY